MSQNDEGLQPPWAAVAGIAIAGVALVWAASLWPALMETTGFATRLPYHGKDDNELLLHPFAEMLKLISAAIIGLIITTVHRYYHRDKPLPRSLLQAQVLLCVAGAMVMVIIGSSVARAFGVAGAAGIVRFRTPVEDPKDSTILFLLIGLGMACGVGLLEVAAMGTAFLCIVLVVLDRFGEAKARSMILSLTATGTEFPTEHVADVLRGSVESFEAREVVQGAEMTIRYNVTMTPHTSILWLNQQLMADGKGGLKAVAWADPTTKKGA